jgi:amino acid transporter
MSAVNHGTPQYVLPTAPWYHFLAALVYNKDVLTVIIVGSFAFWALPAMIPNMFVPCRSLFVFAFDRLIPERFAYVSPKRSAPTVAILFSLVLVAGLVAWVTYSGTLQALVGFSALAGVMIITIVSVAAFFFPNRQPELYRSSPANISWFGVPVVKLMAPIAIAIMAFLVWATIKYPPVAIGTPSHRWWVPTYMAGIAAVGLAIYFGGRAVRRSEGVDIDLVFHELPPD